MHNILSKKKKKKKKKRGNVEDSRAYIINCNSLYIDIHELNEGANYVRNEISVQILFLSKKLLEKGIKP